MSDEYIKAAKDDMRRPLSISVANCPAYGPDALPPVS